MAFGLVFAAVAALCDWWAVDRGLSRVESIAKPAVMVGLGIVVLADRPDMWLALLVALAFSLIGDVLLLPAINRFVPGLSAFLAAHVAYLVAIAPATDASLLTVTGLAGGAALAGVIGRKIASAAAMRDPRLGQAVSMYMIALVLLLGLGVGTGDVVVALGAALFVLSDTVLGWNRFVAALPNGRLVTHVLYHVGQALIVVGLTTGG